MLNKLKDEMIKAVKDAAGIIPKNVTDKEIVAKDGKNNFVTYYDMEVQKRLFACLKKLCPDAHLVGEEDIGEESRKAEKAFIVDPIDGTTNFIHGMKKSAVSVAYTENNQVKIGVVYDPYMDEMFTAVKGEGAFLNGNKIKVSEKKLGEGLVFFGASPYYTEMIDKTFLTAREFMKNSHDIRRLGAASLEICYVACGRAEVQFEYVLCPWDYAAAGFILEEAGGIAGNMEGGKLSLERKDSTLCSNKAAYEDAKKIIENNK